MPSGSMSHHRCSTFDALGFSCALGNYTPVPRWPGCAERPRVCGGYRPFQRQDASALRSPPGSPLPSSEKKKTKKNSKVKHQRWGRQRKESDGERYCRHTALTAQHWKCDSSPHPCEFVVFWPHPRSLSYATPANRSSGFSFTQQRGNPLKAGLRIITVETCPHPTRTPRGLR